MELLCTVFLNITIEGVRWHSHAISGDVTHRLSEGYLQFYSICTWILTPCIFYGVFRVGGVLMYSLFIVWCGLLCTSGVKVKVKYALEQVMKARRRSTGIAILFFNLGARWCGWSTPRPGRFTPGKVAWCPLCRGLGGPQGRSELLREMSPSTGIRSLDRPTRSVSLYRRRCPGKR
jgi:hypothetical protein